MPAEVPDTVKCTKCQRLGLNAEIYTTVLNKNYVILFTVYDFILYNHVLLPIRGFLLTY